MKKLLSLLPAFAAFVLPLHAQVVTTLPAGSALSDTDLLIDVQDGTLGFSSGGITTAITGAQLKTYAQTGAQPLNSSLTSLATGDPFTTAGILTITGTWPNITLTVPTGTTSSTAAVGNDTRFPASVTGMRKSAGAGSTDIAAVQSDLTSLLGSYYTTPSVVAAGYDTFGSAAAAQAASQSILKLGPVSHNFVFIGDSITQGPTGNPALASQSFPAVVQYLGIGQGGAKCYDLGFRQETTGECYGQYYGGSAVTTSITTTSGSTTATVASATGISNGMCIGSANTPPDTTLTISGTTVTLSHKATTTGTVACSIATAPTNVFYGELYPGGAANGWVNFYGTAHILSPAITGIAGDFFAHIGTNDFYENTGAATTLTATTVSGSPNLTVTSSSGTYSSLVNSLVLTGTGLSATTPPYIISGAGTANLVMSSNATASGSVTITVHYPATAFITWQTYLNNLVSTAHADGYTVWISTLIPAGNNPGQGAPISQSFESQWNTFIKANSFGADYIIDTASQFPAQSAVVTGNVYYGPDLLHPSVLGDAVIGKYINDQMFASEFTSVVSGTQQGWNPLGPGSWPDTYLSSNIPRLNTNQTFTAQQSFCWNSASGWTNIQGPYAWLQGSQSGYSNPQIWMTGYFGAANGIYSGDSAVNTACTTNGTTTVTVTGSTSGIVAGMRVFGLDIQTGTSVVSISGSTVTLGVSSVGSGIVGEILTFVTQDGTINFTPTAATLTGGVGPTSDTLTLSTSTGAGILTYNGTTVQQEYGSSGFQNTVVGSGGTECIWLAHAAPTGSRSFGFKNYSGEIDYGFYADTPVLGTITKSFYVTGGSTSAAGTFHTAGNIIEDTATASAMTKYDSSKNLVSATENVDYMGSTTMTSNTTATITFNGGSHNETIYNTSTTPLASATITLPSASTAGQIVRYLTNGTITTLTVAGGTVDAGATPTSLTAPASVAWQCNTNGHWIRLY